jgi:hypothetical protein
MPNVTAHREPDFPVIRWSRLLCQLFSSSLFFDLQLPSREKHHNFQYSQVGDFAVKTMSNSLAQFGHNGVALEAAKELLVVQI